MVVVAAAGAMDEGLDGALTGVVVRLGADPPSSIDAAVICAELEGFTQKISKLLIGEHKLLRLFFSRRQPIRVDATSFGYGKKMNRLQVLSILELGYHWLRHPNPLGQILLR